MVKVSGQDHEVVPSSSGQLSWKWFVDEAIDHLFPWNARFLHQKLAFQAAGIGLALAVTAAWILAAAGRLDSAVVIGWWTGWSVYEVIVRRQCKPWVKDGPWWGTRRRPADTMDLVAYVATKNLLIGALLFLVLTALGVVSPLG